MTIDNTKRISLNKPRLFEPTVNRYLKEGSSGDGYFDKTNNSQFVDTSIGESGSFRYNQAGKGLSSTQQLNIDWSDFSNHTFFNSAQVKTNVAFNKIINEYPFDGTKKETELFFDKLTGFEKWVYDNFPKNKGFITLSGTISGSSNEVGSFITVRDSAGAQYQTLSKKTTGEPILDPGLKSMTVEMFVYVPSQSFGTRSQAIVNKTTGSNLGFSIINENTPTSTTSSVSFLVCSGALQDKVSIPVSYNTWTHVCWTWNRNPGVNQITSYKDTILYSSSSMPIEFGDLGTAGSSLYVGSGSALGTFIPNSTFSGSIDELRIWHHVRNINDIKEYQKKPVFASDFLKLYFKFNEPSGSNSSIVLDHSNNSLHGVLNSRAIQLSIRDTASSSLAGQTPMTLEPMSLCPVLFPAFPANDTLRSELLLSASIYDTQNPSLITNLVPKHFLIEGKAKDSLSDEQGEIVNIQDTDGTEPKGNKLGGTQVLLSLLYTWAKFFDELKLYLQAFSTLKTIDYNLENTVPDEFLPFFAQMEGINLPPLFVGTSISQFIEGQNLSNEISSNTDTLQYIQNQVWRRILINLPDIIKSKGTIHSIKSFIRSIGIDPDSVFRIREYGGPTKSSLDFIRENRTEVSTMLDFVSGGYLKSPFLTGSRVEPGYPYYSSTGNDIGVLTSGSFTYEGTYKFEPTNNNPMPQSLVRFRVSGSQTTTTGSLVSNLVLTSASNGYYLTLYAQPNVSSPSLLTLQLTGANIVDGDQWYVSFGRIRNDDPGFTDILDSSAVSGTYFLRAGKQNNGELLESYYTSSNYLESTATNSIFQKTSTGLSGVYFEVGSGSVSSGASFLLLENSSYTTSSRETNFTGKLTQIRFWSKYINDLEWKEHIKYFRSVGVQNPKTHWNFANINVSGAFERLRIDASTDQIITNTDSSGGILLTDFTQNNLSISGTNFPITSSVIVPERFTFSYVSPKIDEGMSDNKVRVRSFQDASKLDQNPWAQVAPIYETEHFLSPKDSTKLSIDFSIVDTLNQDIMTIFSSLDEMNNYIGNPELMFADGYKDLDNLRDLYYNKLQDKINIKGFFEFYKWFDTNIGIFVNQLVPRKTKFLGCNFVVESSILERNKFKYQFEDHWLGEEIRSGQKDVLVLQIIEGEFNKL